MKKRKQNFQLFSAKDGSEIGSFSNSNRKFDDAQMIPLSKVLRLNLAKRQ